MVVEPIWFYPELCGFYFVEEIFMKNNKKERNFGYHLVGNNFENPANDRRRINKNSRKIC
jgi:hypothetical protein